MASGPEQQPDIQQPEDDVLSPKLRRRLQECFEQGSKLASQEKCNYDYADAMFTQCVVNDPGNLVYVQAFLENLQRKYDNNKRGARIKGFGGRGPFKKALAKKQWREVLRLGLNILKTNPWDVPTLRGMAQACEALAYPEVELRYLKNALDANPRDADVNRHCARSLARLGQFDQAIACWHRVEEIDPNDKEATRMVSMLTTEKTRLQAGLAPQTAPGAKVAAGQSSSGPGPKSKPWAKPDPTQRRREIPRTRRQELQRAIADDPTNLDAHLELAGLLRQEHRFGDAEEVLAKALDLSGGDLKVRERLEDIQIDRARAQLAVAEKRAQAEKTEQARTLVLKMRDQLNRRELEVLGARAERYPADHSWKYRLAVCLKRAGNHAEAINYLLKAREDKQLKAAATLEMGECFQHQKRFTKALRCYARAAEVAREDLDCKKLALYRAGVLATAMQELDKAESCLQQLAGIDPHYKDLPTRLDKIKRIRDKG